MADAKVSKGYSMGRKSQGHPGRAMARLADTPGLAPAWRDKIVQRLTWLKQ